MRIFNRIMGIYEKLDYMYFAFINFLSRNKALLYLLLVSRKINYTENLDLFNTTGYSV